MFAFDAADRHFLDCHLDEASTPVALATALDTTEDDNGGTLEHDDTHFAATKASDATNRRSYDFSPKAIAGSRLTAEPAGPSMTRHGTPPIDIVMTPSACRSRSRAREDQGESTFVDATPRPSHQAGKPGRKKKRGPKKGAVAALSTVRGFTPATSGDEDSDFSSSGFRKRKDLSVQRSSSIVRKDLNHDSPGSFGSDHGVRSSSPSGGISALTQQLDALDCDHDIGRSPMIRSISKLGPEIPSSSSVTSGTSGDEDTSEMTSYEVPLDYDFISPDVSSRENGSARQGSQANGDTVRKMQATDFDPLRCLGKGTYGTVLLVKQAGTGKLYAQKQFRKASLTVRKQLVDQTKTERNILESINRHPFVVKLYYAFQDHEKLYLILEYAQGGELFERMRTERMFPEDIAAFYMAEMVLALEHLHHNVGVVYRDLKPENCLLDSEGHLLLTDFGLSKVAVDGEHRCKSMTGTVEYMAPEVIQMQSYGTAVDWWSFGILGFDLLTGSSPFSANNDGKIKEKILKSKLVLPYFLSPDAKDLLTRLLRKEPKKRLGACMPRDMQTIKNHRFFRKIQWAKLEKRELEPPITPLITDPELAENFSPEFTELAVSPVLPAPLHAATLKDENDPFGGFSFVGSRSLLESGTGFF
ncbi:serine/threonine protein kinase psk1 [Mycoblastus sanguinarius]|nr:serine/threonine protein kinase psk1 [Mycoblastus sanguinarius]